MQHTIIRKQWFCIAASRFRIIGQVVSSHSQRYDHDVIISYSYSKRLLCSLLGLGRHAFWCDAVGVADGCCDDLSLSISHSASALTAGADYVNNTIIKNKKKQTRTTDTKRHRACRAISVTVRSGSRVLFIRMYVLCVCVCRICV